MYNLIEKKVERKVEQAFEKANTRVFVSIKFIACGYRY